MADKSEGIEIEVSQIEFSFGTPTWEPLARKEWMKSGGFVWDMVEISEQHFIQAQIEADEPIIVELGGGNDGK